MNVNTENIVKVINKIKQVPIYTNWETPSEEIEVHPNDGECVKKSLSRILGTYHFFLQSGRFLLSVIQHSCQGQTLHKVYTKSLSRHTKFTTYEIAVPYI